jgi:hypothetical protein
MGVTMARARLHGGTGPLRRRDEFALSPHQLSAVSDPFAPIRALVASQTDEFAGRPYSLWRDDPEIARALNNGLSPPGD